MYVSEDEATQWLKSVGLSFFSRTSSLIRSSLIIAFFNCVLPLLATTYLGKTGILERLTDANTAVEYFAQHGMSEAEVGTAGVVRVTSTPQQVAPPLFMTNSKPGESTKVLPILNATSGISTEVTATSLFIDEETSQDLIVDSRAIQSAMNREGATNDVIIICICKTLVPILS